MQPLSAHSDDTKKDTWIFSCCYFVLGIVELVHFINYSPLPTRRSWTARPGWFLANVACLSNDLSGVPIGSVLRPLEGSSFPTSLRVVPFVVDS
jgi:hypothetical protein